MYLISKYRSRKKSVGFFSSKYHIRQEPGRGNLYPSVPEGEAAIIVQ